ncbi:MAG: 16S rRNA (cytosine(1402)-N(4))-methyltransferase RsmH [Candidatus Zixiibacteriota bacterium]|nr:MAG: 16S rRNA (cytosine(1402)-N(4))-methyltransferase RsmH [candidate division Zixibacteria bacterium]
MHQPVLVKEVLEGLVPEKCDVIVDATVGTGGHAEAILTKLKRKAKLICIDRDGNALRIAKRRLAEHKDRVHFAHLQFNRIEDLLLDLKISSVSGFLFDLGLCALHLQNAKRGFSFQLDGPLDMRMDRSQSKNACEVVSTYSFPRLTRILRESGQERFSRRIARAVVNRRRRSPILTTFQLRDIVESAIDRRYRIKSLARVFQAIRIEVNDELNQLKEGLSQAIRLLAPGGRLALVSYHSLEHRLIREKIRQKSRGCICPPDLPVCGCGAKAVLRVITRRPVVPTPEEIEANPSARSARLWAAEKLGGGAAEE